MFAELRELLRSGAIRRHQLGSKGILTPMIHGLLRISCSRNPKTPQIRSFFYEKWLLFHDLAGFIDIKMYASIHFMSISPLDIKISYTAV